MDLRLTGRRALITGGSRGIGKEIARRLAAEGVECVVCSRDTERARTAADEITAESGRRAHGEAVELSDAGSVRAMIARVHDRLGGVDILINSGSSVSGYVAEDFAHLTDEFVLSSFEEKFVGSLRCCREVVPFMRQQGWGSIVNICGHSARVAGWIAAGARNAAMVSLTKNLARELGPAGVRVNAIHPSTTVTETLEVRMQSLAGFRGVSLDDQMRHAIEESSIGRLVTAREVADAAVFLASPAAGGVTGEVLAVTGGAGRAIHY
jgi:NAD(P)-dependent dehydrogenase (short-subunit alcohol dehydrogenase family)